MVRTYQIIYAQGPQKGGSPRTRTSQNSRLALNKLDKKEMADRMHIDNEPNKYCPMQSSIIIIKVT